MSNGDPKDGTELRPKGSSVGISMILGKMDVVVMCIVGPRWENREDGGDGREAAAAAAAVAVAEDAAAVAVDALGGR